MKRTLLIFFVLIVLGGLGYGGYKYFWPGSKNQSGGPLNEAQLCDVDNHTCSSIQKVTNSGILKVTITASGKSVSGLEVDVATKPGAQKYYMKLTDSNGTVIFDGIPAGNYTVYFNSNNFPQQFGSPPAETVSVVSGQTAEKNIDLISK